MLDKFVVCDLETTGLSPHRHEIIEFGLVRVEGGEIKDTLHSLIRPRQKLPVGIRRLTGLADGDFQNSPELGEVLPRVLDFLQGHPLVGHNVSFDKEFLEAAAGKIGNPIYDTLELARIVLPFSPGYRLNDLCRFLGIENKNEHRALSDALATVELYHRLIAFLKELDVKILFSLHAFLQRAASSWAVPLALLIREAAQDALDTKITPVLFFAEPGFPDEPGDAVAGQKELSPGAGELPSLLAPEGLLAARMENYEYRPQQIEMISAVVRALTEKKHLLMEAGTGTGKSLAYLIPVIHHALTNGERVVVATYTINLQGQLWQKDVPGLTTALSWPCRTVLLKGRQHYLCLRRWLNILTAGNWSAGEAAFWARVLVWATKTKTGDRAELNLNLREQECWSLICADSEGCLGALCPWLRNCYVTRARKAAEAANLIITNHSLLFSDLRADNRLLPVYGPLIIDEAHHLEDVATEQLGTRVTRAQFKRWLNAVGRLLTRLTGLIPPAEAPFWGELLRKAQEERQKAGRAADIFFADLVELIRERAGWGARESGRYTLRLRGEGEKKIPSLEPGYANLSLACSQLLKCLQQIVNLLEGWLIIEREWQNYYGETLGHLAAGKDLEARFAFILGREEENYVYWVEAAVLEESPEISLHAAPVYVGKLIYEHLFEPKETIVLTSATLSVEGDFSYFMERVGLDLVPSERLTKVLVDSPFRYDQQALLCVVKNVPLQGEVAEEEYFEALLAVLTDLIRVVQGKMLVLFTSHRSLQETYRRLKGFCEETDIYLLAHNIDGSRARPVEEFRSNERSVLLGAASFWEGVDIPGDALSCVVIVKLPFGVPDVPVVQARLEDLSRRGKDGFRHFTLPQAVLRFKQGFGRLIRTIQDRGVVVVLDHRLISRRYGEQFLNSLPLKRHMRGNSAAVSGGVARWLQK